MHDNNENRLKKAEESVANKSESETRAELDKEYCERKKLKQIEEHDQRSSSSSTSLPKTSKIRMREYRERKKFKKQLEHDQRSSSSSTSTPKTSTLRMREYRQRQKLKKQLEHDQRSSSSSTSLPKTSTIRMREYRERRKLKKQLGHDQRSSSSSTSTPKTSTIRMREYRQRQKLKKQLEQSIENGILNMEDLKQCFIHTCPRTSVNSPQHLFFNIPKYLRKRKDIMKISKVPMTDQAKYYCCEDHFDLETDCVSFKSWKKYGGSLKLSKNVAPRFNLKRCHYRELNIFCFVPTCENTAKRCPGKLFFKVPMDYKKLVWFRAVKRNDIPERGNYYCCQDHFNLKCDTKESNSKSEKGFHWAISIGQLELKDGVLPHLKLEGNKPLTPEEIQDKLFSRMNNLSEFADYDDDNGEEIEDEEEEREVTLEELKALEQSIWTSSFCDDFKEEEDEDSN